MPESARLRAPPGTGHMEYRDGLQEQREKSVEVPAYEYAIKASEGSFHPYAPDNKAGLTLRPGKRKRW